jgi:hypothetical protein
MLSKTQNGSDFNVLLLEENASGIMNVTTQKLRNNYSLHVQEVVLCKKKTQR